MKRLILAASALVSAVALTTSANAADIAPMPSAYDWSGFYVGLNAGAAWNNTEIDNEIDADLPDDVLNDIGNDLTDDDAVFTGGALIGYNWQMESLVLGVEADINYLGFDGDASNERFDILETIPSTSKPPVLNTSHDLSFDASWFGTLRGRLGFAADNFLFYGTGGLAFGHMEAESDFRIYDELGDEIGRWKGSVDDVNWGWTIGAGMEYGIDNWSLGIEYLFVDLGDADWDAEWEGVDAPDVVTDASSEGSVDYQFSVVRATAKVRF